MNHIFKQPLIKRENLNEEHYFQSILQEATRLGLLTDSELENIQLQSIELLAKQTNRYTAGDSSSVKIDVAHSLLLSIFYSIGVYLKSFGDIESSIGIIKEKSIARLYKTGLELVKKRFKTAKLLLAAVQKNSIDTENIAYNDTIKNGLAPFFLEYDIEFAPQDSPGSIDYPLCNDKMNVVGIEYIYGYLQKLYWENQFCKNFSPVDIESLLRGYEKNYPDLLINIFQHVLTNALACILVNKNVLLLDIQDIDRLQLYQKLNPLSARQLNDILEDTASRLFTELAVSNDFLKEYILSAAKEISVRLKNVLELRQLETLFVSLKKKDSPQPFMNAAYGEQLDDDLFREIFEEIQACRFAKDKIILIQNEIHCITDLIDILESDCIFDTEYLEIFQSFGDMELAMLLKSKTTYPDDFSSILPEDEKEWHRMIHIFLNEIDPDRRKTIEELAEKINLG